MLVLAVLLRFGGRPVEVAEIVSTVPQHVRDALLWVATRLESERVMVEPCNNLVRELGYALAGAAEWDLFVDDEGLEDDVVKAAVFDNGFEKWAILFEPDGECVRVKQA